jgi:hypothetical protein
LSAQEEKSPQGNHSEARVRGQIVMGCPLKPRILWCLKEDEYLSPFSKKGTGQIAAKINWFSVSVLKIAVLTVI